MTTTPSTRNFLTTLCAAAVLLAGAQSSLAQSGTWTNTLNDTWSNTANWLGGTVANGAGNTADFNTLDLTAQTLVTNDAARTLGTLIFGDTDTNTPAGWLVSNGGTAGNTLTVTNITVNPIFAANSEAATNDATIAAVIAGSGVVKSGAGTVHLTVSNAFTSLQVDAGVAAIGVTGAAGQGNRRVIYNGGGIRLMTNNTFANTNFVLTSGHLYAPPANYDIFNGPIIGSSSATLYIHATSGRFTVNGAAAATMSNYFGTIDLADSAAGLVRLNLGAGPYNCSAITFNLGTNGGRIAPRITAAVSTFRLGSLSGGPSTRLESSEQGAGLNTTWEIGELNTSTLFEGRMINYNGTVGRHGHLRKVGTGTLVLTHASHAYTGITTVSNGVLALSNSAAIATSPSIIVAAGARFDVSALTAGTWSTAAAQTLGGNGGVIGYVAILAGTIAPGNGGVGTLSFTNNLTLDGTLTSTNLFELTSPGTADLIQVAGNLSFSNNVVIRVVPTGGSIPDGTYTLIKYGGVLIGDTNNMTLSYPAQPGTFILQTNLVAKEIRLVVSGVAPAANLVWKGDGLANDWDIVTANWLNGVTPSLFVNADKVTFNDVGSNNVPVNLASSINPGALVFDATKNYNIGSSGAFGIVGNSGLVKSNTGVVTVTSDNTFGGGTLIQNGTVQIGDGVLSSGNLGSGNITNNAQLLYNRPDNVTTANLIVGSGSVVQAAPSVLTIAGANTYAGGTVASNGTINLGAYNTLGSGTLNMAGGTVIIVPSGGATTGVSNNINITQDSILQYNAGNSFAAVILAPISGVNSKTLTINHAPNGGQDRLRLYSAFTNDANLVLNNAAVWIAPYLASGVQQYNGVVSGSGSFVHRGGGGTVIFNTNNTFTGDARMTQGTYGVGVDSVGSYPSLTSSPLGLGSLVLTNESDGVGGNGGITAINGARNVGNAINYSRTNEFTLIVSGANDLTLSGPVSLHGQVDGFGGVNRTLQVDSTGKTTFAGEIGDGALNCGLTKTGAGTLYLNALNSYTGTTLVSAGSLGGTGVIVGPVVVGASGTLAPGASIGTLSVSNNLEIAGSLAIEINKSIAATNDRVVVSGGLTNTGTGTVTVTNLGPAFVAGDSFKLFSKAVQGGLTLTITPDPGAGLVWTNKLAVDGSIAVLSTNAGPVIPTNPTNITFSASGGNLTLSWPADHIGWSLQAQTNTRAIGLKTNWFTLTGYETTNTAVIPISPASPTVFYRLNYLIP